MGSQNRFFFMPVYVLVLDLMAVEVRAQSDIHVDEHATGPLHDGMTWCTAFLSLDVALSVAVSGDSVLIADGTYTPDPTGLVDSRDATFDLVNDVAIEGGYAGCGAPDPNERDPIGNVSILSGDLSGNDGADFLGNDENVYHVLSGSGITSAIVDGLTITGGNANVTGTRRIGAGVYLVNSEPTLINCSIIENSAVEGGGMYNDASAATIQDCMFLRNRAEASAGASVSGGAGMFNNNGSDVVINGCHFEDNIAGWNKDGGGIQNDGSNPSVTDCVFVGNVGDAGGGIFSDNGSRAVITRCLFLNNQAPRGGAGIANWFSACATVTDCRFLGNVSDGSIFFGGRGGAVQEDIQDTCNSKYINCTFSGNIADVEGGAVWMGTSLAEFVNCTFTSNVAATGGAIFYWQFSSPTLTNCILFNDTPDELATTRTIPPTVTYSNIEGGFTGEGNIDVDPLFVDAAGPDAIVGTEDDNLRLSPGSPCIDAGDNDIVLTLGVGTDIGGLPRRFDDCHTVDTGRGEPPLVDMGPYEFSDDSDDADGDGVCDAEDICPGGDDKIDSDGDGAPDDCDPCPADNPDDTDGDGVCESADICPDSDDTIDSDGDGVPDGCDLCPGGDDSIDTDADSVPDDCDRCPGSDDSIDTDGDGLPDDCDICDNRFPDSCTFTSPIQAPPPHDIHKNRYLSIDHRGEDAVNVGVGYDLRIELSATLVNGVTAVGLHWWAHTPDADCISVVGWSRPATPPNWNACPTVHLTGCPVIPTSTYAISIVVGDLLSVPPFTAETQTKPGVRWHGDAVGFFDSDTNTWTPPQGTVNIDDAVAAIKTFRNPNAASATHVSVTDMEPNLPGTQINRLVNINDVFSIIKGFQGFEYPGPSIQLCPDA